jgi:hypothetical protein
MTETPRGKEWIEKLVRRFSNEPPSPGWASGSLKRKLVFTGLATLVATGLLVSSGVHFPTRQNASPSTARPAPEPHTSPPTAAPATHLPERPAQPAPPPQLKQGIGPPMVTPRPASAFWQ